MRNVISVTIAGVLCSLLLGGCLAGSGAQSKDLAELKRRLAVIEQATVAKQSEQSFDKRLADQAARVASLQAEVDGLRFELQRLAGQYEDAAHRNKELHEVFNLMRSELELKIKNLEEQLASRPQAPATAPVTPPPVTAQSPAEIEQEYQQALKLIQKEGAYREGRKQLQRFLRDHPQHELAVNAFYWIGEAYYGEKQYEKAILQFQDVIQKYPQHPKAPAALLKQAIAFGVAGEKGMEAELLKKVVSNYPKSPEAKKAEGLLKK